jgi:programmed cell death 8 (apoptosis-inducing factor)
MRPPLSKEFWFEDLDHAAGSKNFKQWNGKQRSAFFEPDEYYMPYEDLMDSPSGGVSLVTGVKVTRLLGRKMQTSYL